MLMPGTETFKHQGRTNGVLTMHLGIRVPEGVGIVVGDEERDAPWQEGKVTMFDDSFPHAVWHRGPETSSPRAVLLFRTWHPDYTLAERLASVRSKFGDIMKEERRTGKKAKGPRVTQEVLQRRVKYLKSQEAKKRWKHLSKIFRQGVLEPDIGTEKKEL